LSKKKEKPSGRELSRLVRAWDDVAEQPELASKVMEHAIKKYPAFAPGWGHLGLAYMQCGRAKDAEGALLEAASLEPESAGWHLALSTLYKLAVANAKGLTERVEHARRLVEAGLTLSPDLLNPPPDYVKQITLIALNCSYEYAHQMSEQHAKQVLNLTQDKEFTYPAINNLIEVQMADGI
jgi:tetratricopeptide (TPR) repeat protein